jgi:hypothetical protein
MSGDVIHFKTFKQLELELSACWEKANGSTRRPTYRGIAATNRPKFANTLVQLETI